MGLACIQQAQKSYVLGFAQTCGMLCSVNAWSDIHHQNVSSTITCRLRNVCILLQAYLHHLKDAAADQTHMKLLLQQSHQSSVSLTASKSQETELESVRRQLM